MLPDIQTIGYNLLVRKKSHSTNFQEAHEFSSKFIEFLADKLKEGLFQINPSEEQLKAVQDIIDGWCTSGVQIEEVYKYFTPSPLFVLEITPDYRSGVELFVSWSVKKRFPHRANLGSVKESFSPGIDFLFFPEKPKSAEELQDENDRDFDRGISFAYNEIADRVILTSKSFEEEKNFLTSAQYFHIGDINSLAANNQVCVYANNEAEQTRTEDFEDTLLVL